MLSKSDAGKLGHAKAEAALKIINAAKAQQAREVYERSPKVCACGNVLPYEKKKHKFCSHRCSAITSQAIRRGEVGDYVEKAQVCATCGCRLKTGYTYCSLLCQQQKAWCDRKGKALLTGVFDSDHAAKRYLLERNGIRCSHCGLTEWLGKPITVFLDHVNGQATDRRVGNFRLLCPNCDSQMPTWGGRNIGNGRAWRRARYLKVKDS